MEIIYYGWIGILSLIGAFTVFVLAAALRDYYRCKKYELEQNQKN